MVAGLAFPPCRQCGKGGLVPLSDFGPGVTIRYKAWVCTSPGCGFNLKMRGGEVCGNEPIFKGRSGAPRPSAHTAPGSPRGARGECRGVQLNAPNGKAPGPPPGAHGGRAVSGHRPANLSRPGLSCRRM